MTQRTGSWTGAGSALPPPDGIAAEFVQSLSTKSPCVRSSPAPLHGLAERVGTPFFLYDQRTIENSVAAARSFLPQGARLCFAIKANSAPGILSVFARLGVGAEAASAGELRMAMAAEIPASRIVFSGPAKTEADHQAAVLAGVAALHVESPQELEAVEAICGAMNRRVRVALRVALPGQGGSRRLGWGALSPFGMPTEEAMAIGERRRYFPHIDLIGLHHHAASQVLDGARIAARLAVFGAFSAAWRERFGLTYANIGGGFGVPSYADDQPLELGPIKNALAALIQSGGPFAGLGAGLTAEPGRFLIGPAGSYVSRVVRTRVIGRQRFAFLDGGTHHVHGLSGTQRALGRPVAVDCLRISTAALAPFELAGPLCTPADRLASEALLPADLTPGDLLLFRHAGAYATSASPFTFLGHDLPAEVLIDGDDATVIAPRQTVAALWQPKCGGALRP